MKTKLTRIHLGLGMPEIGVQFETLDADGAKTSTQRAFVAVDAGVLAPIWAAAQAALAASLDKLPIETPDEEVTTLLMRRRTARAAAEEAEKDAQEARAKADDARRERAEAERERDAARGHDGRAKVRAP